jgi:hypothetical protein
MDDAQELLLAMSIATRAEAQHHLSDAGREVLDMIELVSRTSKISVADAWVEASATATLSEGDKDVLIVYVARMSLIEAFDQQALAEGEREEDRWPKT